MNLDSVLRNGVTYEPPRKRLRAVNDDAALLKHSTMGDTERKHDRVESFASAMNNSGQPTMRQRPLDEFFMRA